MKNFTLRGEKDHKKGWDPGIREKRPGEVYPGRSGFREWRGWDSNPQPADYEPAALPLELPRQSMIIITPSRPRRQRGRVPGCVPKSQDNCSRLSYKAARPDKIGTHPGIEARDPRAGILGQPVDVRGGTTGHGRLGIRESWIGLLRALSA